MIRLSRKTALGINTDGEWHVPSKTEFDLLVPGNAGMNAKLQDTFLNHMNGGTNYYRIGSDSKAWIINSCNTSGSWGALRTRRYSWFNGRYAGGTDTYVPSDDYPMYVFVSKIRERLKYANNAEPKYYVGYAHAVLIAANNQRIFGYTLPTLPAFSVKEKGDSLNITDMVLSPQYPWYVPSPSAPAGTVFPEQDSTNVESRGYVRHIGWIDTAYYPPGEGNKVLFQTQQEYEEMYANPNFLKVGDTITGINRNIVLIPLFALASLSIH
jgi:hypothetical protein